MNYFVGFAFFGTIITTNVVYFIGEKHCVGGEYSAFRFFPEDPKLNSSPL